METRVLYVDDETDLLELAKTFFAEEQISLDVTDSFQDALSIARTKQYDLIISDANMPDGNGYELYRRLRSECGFRGHFFLLTGNLQPDADVGDFQEVIYKPVDFPDLVHKVRQYLA